MKKKVIDLPVIPTKLSKEEREENRIPALEKIFGKKGAKTRYRHRQERRESDWYETVNRFEANPSLYNAYRYIQNHPVFWRFQKVGDWELFHERCLYHEGGIREGIEFTVERVNPKTRCISPDPALNTRVEIWCEFFITSHWLEPVETARMNDYRLHTGGATYEEALIKAAKRLHRFYGNDRRKLKKYDEASANG